MHMLYNSDSFVVVHFDVPAALQGQSGPERDDALTHGGYEIVDKFARKEIYIEGALAERFQDGVRQLVEAGPGEGAIDEFIAGFTSMAQQPVVMH